MKKVFVDWDVEDDIQLPYIVEVPDSLEEGLISDWLSDEYGWCVNSWYYKN